MPWRWTGSRRLDVATTSSPRRAEASRAHTSVAPVRKRRRIRSRCVRLAPLALMALAACGAGDIGDLVGALGVGTLTSIAISGDTLVAVGDTVRLSARGRDDGLLGIFGYDRLLDAVWSVSDPSVASIVTIHPPPGDSTSTSAVIVTGRRVGTVLITATARGVQGAMDVDVVGSQ